MKHLTALATLALATTLSACASTSPPQVSTFDRAAELGGVPRGSVMIDGESFISNRAASAAAYNQAVETRLAGLGYAPTAGTSAQFRAEVDVRQDEATGPSGASVGIGGGSYGGNVGLGGGLSLPLGSSTRTLTEMQVRLIRTSDNLTVWEGRAQQELKGDIDNVVLAQTLADAMFADFPR